MFGGAVYGVDVVVAVMKEIAHFLPWAGRCAGILAAQCFVQIGKAFMGLAVALVQLDKGACQPRRVRCGKLKIGQRQGIPLEQGVRQNFAHVTDQALAVTAGQFGHVHPEFRRKRQNHRRTDGTVIIFHLVEVREGNAQFGGEILLRATKLGAQFAQFRASIELLGRHPDQGLCKFAYNPMLALQSPADKARHQRKPAVS
jgi:hypothetical protein